MASFGTTTAPDIQPIAPVELTSTSTIATYIAEEASKKQFNPKVALAIAKAESGFHPKAKNPVGTASGVYQFLDSTFQNYCIEEYKLTDTMDQKNDVRIQVECALLIMTTDSKGVDHWLASKYSWGPSQDG